MQMSNDYEIVKTQRFQKKERSRVVDLKIILRDD